MTKALKPPQEPTRANLYFPPKGVQPKGLDGIGLNQDVTILVKGKVDSLGSEYWEEGTRISIKIDSCEILTPQKKPVSLDEAIKGARKKV